MLFFFFFFITSHFKNIGWELWVFMDKNIFFERKKEEWHAIFFFFFVKCYLKSEFQPLMIPLAWQER